MFKLALRQLRLDPWSTVLTTIAIGSIIAVILILQGFEQGQYYQLKQIVLIDSESKVHAAVATWEDDKKENVHLHKDGKKHVH